MRGTPGQEEMEDGKALSGEDSWHRLFGPPQISQLKRSRGRKDNVVANFSRNPCILSS